MTLLIILIVYILIGILVANRHVKDLQKNTATDKIGLVLVWLGFMLFYPIFYIITFPLIIIKLRKNK